MLKLKMFPFGLEASNAALARCSGLLETFSSKYGFTYD